MYPQRIIPVSFSRAPPGLSPMLLGALQPWLLDQARRLRVPVPGIQDCALTPYDRRFLPFLLFYQPGNGRLRVPADGAIRSYNVYQLPPTTELPKPIDLDIKWPSEMPVVPQAGPPIAPPTLNPLVIVGNVLDLLV